MPCAHCHGDGIWFTTGPEDDDFSDGIDIPCPWCQSLERFDAVIVTSGAVTSRRSVWRDKFIKKQKQSVWRR